MKFETPVAKNEKYNITITDIGSEGEGIGRIDGFTIFVEGGLPGDELEILIVKSKKSFAYGKIINIITPSTDRVEPACKYFKQCGGCQLQHLSYGAQLEYKSSKVKSALERIGGIKDVEVMPTLGMEKPYYYRNKAQFPVGNQNGEVKIGFFAKRSHNIINIDSCMIQHEINDKITMIVRNFIEEYNVPAYDEVNHKGIIRHILSKVGFSTKEVMVCIVINGKKLPYSEKLVEKLVEIEGMTSIVLNKNSNKTNVILGDKIEVLWGKDCICDYIGDVKFEISPFSFFQVNPIQTKVLYEKALELADLKGNETVLDIYCGIGTISLCFAKKAKKVLGVEIIPEAIEDAVKNALINDIKNVEFRVGSAEDIIPRIYDEEGFKADVVVVDPPRKGCDMKVLETIINMKPEKIIYVSCDPATLARDLSVLCENGYNVGKVQPVDQFSQTVHVEVCIELCRK